MKAGRLRSWLARSLGGERGRATRLVLGPVAKLYGTAALLRAEGYAKGYFETKRLDRPVISVGNVTLGGTGKTPLVAALASYLSEQKLEVVVLTRGYGRRRKGREVLRSESGEMPAEAFERGGDEPALLARELPGVNIVVDADRYAAGRWAERELDPDVFLLDDGFQHLRLGRDLDLLVVDATDPFGGFRLPPLGRLREPLQGIRRADAVVVTRTNRPFDGAMIDRVVRGMCGEDVPIFHAHHDLTELRPLAGGESMAPTRLRGQAVGVLTAIGNPRVLLDDLADAGIEVVSETLFADHHDFDQADVDGAFGRAKDAGATVMVTTEKDSVKLERLDLTRLSVYAARIRFRSEQEALVKSLCLETVLARGHSSESAKP